MSDVYERLRKATPTELLEAAVRFYTKHADRPDEVERLLRLGFALAQSDGWQRIAPAWLDEGKMHWGPSLEFGR